MLLAPGSSLGGARPKASIQANDGSLWIAKFPSCNYIPHAENIVIVGATGAGKSYLAQALGQAAEWLDQIPIPVAAEAITDRLSAKAYRIIIQGSTSMRLSH